MQYSKGIKPGTYNLKQAMFSKMFTIAIREWLKENPVSKIPKDKENNQYGKWLSEEGERRLLENIPGWLREIVLLALHIALHTGFKAGRIAFTNMG